MKMKTYVKLYALFLVVWVWYAIKLIDKKHAELYGPDLSGLANIGSIKKGIR